MLYDMLKHVRLRSSGVGGLLAALVLGSAAQGATNEGQYAVRGVGSTTCAEFLEELEASGGLPLRYVAWVSGYLTALNRDTPDTFDVSYIAENDDVLALASRICMTQSDILVETAVARLVNFMVDDRLEGSSNLTQLEVGDTRLTIRQSVYDAFVSVLVAAGYLEEVGEFDEGIRDAILAFQEDRDLSLTGLPDTNTLVAAFTPAS